MSQTFKFRTSPPPSRESLLDLGRRHLCVFAHQDDELPYAGLLSRLAPSAKFLWVTNGDGLAPEVHEDPTQYAEKRIAECINVLKVLDVPAERYRFLWYSEIEIYDRLADLSQGKDPAAAFALYERIYQDILAGLRAAEPDVVWTLAFQGGHVEHDLTHFLTALALRRIRAERKAEIPLMQLPEYEFTILVPLRFRPWYDGPIYHITLEEREAEIKRRVAECYPSQVGLIAKFEKVIGRIGWAAKLVGRGFTFEDYNRREEFGPVPVDFDYLAAPHALGFFTYMFEEHTGIPITFAKCLRPVMSHFFARFGEADAR